jgi:hypothetical protein
MEQTGNGTCIGEQPGNGTCCMHCMIPWLWWCGWPAAAYVPLLLALGQTLPTPTSPYLFPYLVSVKSEYGSELLRVPLWVSLHPWVHLGLWPFAASYLAWGRSRIQQRITGKKIYFCSTHYVGNFYLYLLCPCCAEAENTRAVNSWRRAGGDPSQVAPRPSGTSVLPITEPTTLRHEPEVPSAASVSPITEPTTLRHEPEVPSAASVSPITEPEMSVVVGVVDRPGVEIEVVTPTGETLTCQVPQNLKRGQEFQLKVPAGSKIVHKKTQADARTKQMLVKFYKKHLEPANGKKNTFGEIMTKVEEILESYKGREEQMWKDLSVQYGVDVQEFTGISSSLPPPQQQQNMQR